MRLSGEFFPIAALDDSPSGAEVLGVPVLGNSSLLSQLKAEGIQRAVLGIGSVQNHRARAKLYDRLVAAGFKIPNLIHPRAAVEPSVVMGVGNQIFAGAVVGSAAKLGDNTIIVEPLSRTIASSPRTRTCLQEPSWRAASKSAKTHW